MVFYELLIDQNRVEEDKISARQLATGEFVQFNEQGRG
jgi:hypothetical protein